MAVLVAVLAWQWFDGHLGENLEAGGPAINRSFPSPISGLIINLERFSCSSDFRTCGLDLSYENIGGFADPEAGSCPADPARFVTLIDRRGRHYSPDPGGCPSSRPDWPEQVGQLMPTTVNFSLPPEAAASRLLVAGQLIDLQTPDRIIPAQPMGEVFSDQSGVINYRLAGLNCQVLADAGRDEAHRWWRRLTNQVNNDRYNPDRNLTTGKVFNHWQVCRLVVDYENTSPGTDLFWQDSCQAATYRNVRLIDSRGRQHEALGDRICQPGEVIWPAGGRSSETVEFVIDRQLEADRVLIVDRLVDYSR